MPEAIDLSSDGGVLKEILKVRQRIVKINFIENIGKHYHFYRLSLTSTVFLMSFNMPEGCGSKTHEL